MFDIGFSEVLLIFILALIVLGPEKLPKVASQVGRWIGRARGMARQFREQLEEEVNLEELRRTTQQAQQAVNPTPPPPAPPPPSEATSSEAQPAATGSPPGTGSPHAGAASYIPPTPEPEQPVYPDTYSHAHPTDSVGRPIPPPTTEPPPPAHESGQQDWVEGVTGPKK